VEFILLNMEFTGLLFNDMEFTEIPSNMISTSEIPFNITWIHWGSIPLH